MFSAGFRPAPWIGVVVAAWLAGRTATAQDAKSTEAATKNNGPKANWLPVLRKHAAEYAITATPPGKDVVTAGFVPDPLMRWTQPVRGGDDGVLCLWVDKGRPVAAMTIFTFKSDDGNRCVVHEHQSLSALPMKATWQGRPMWHTSEPGLTFSEAPDAPTPAETPAGRLRQMQAMARDFSGVTRDHKGSSWNLRPLTKPLYRYEKTGPEVVDGGLFTLVQGNDPEAFVLIEARPDPKDAKTSRWHFGVARLTDLRLKVRWKDREVFSVDYTIGAADAPYQSVVAVKKPSESPDDFAAP